LLRYRYAFFKGKKNKPPLLFWRLLNRQPSTSSRSGKATTLNIGAEKPHNSLPLHAHSLTLRFVKTSLRSQSVVAVSDRNTATRSAKKAFYIQNRPTLFLLHLGC